MQNGQFYNGIKAFIQHELQTANATGSGADDYIERGIDLKKNSSENKPATFFMRRKRVFKKLKRNQQNFFVGCELIKVYPVVFY